MNRLIVIASVCLMALTMSADGSYVQAQEKPNILWLVSEDNSPLIGAYGDRFATTPHIDKLAEEGFLYTHAYANAPVCAPARNTIITGVYANSNGHQHMRSSYAKATQVRLFPEWMAKEGYYTTNNAKEDYNILQEQVEGVWDESSADAHYNQRESGQPFFAVFNCGLSHEGTIHHSHLLSDSEIRHSMKDVPLPPYHPDTPEMRKDWARYYDRIEEMDQWVGEKLEELARSGEAENTIVIYYGDHGGVLARSKRFVYETGTRVPFIVRIPEKFKHLWPNEKVGTEVNRLISFVDLAPTMLSLAGADIPDYMQGKAFLGEQQAVVEPEYAYMFRGRMDEKYDMSRAVRDNKFRYIRNYMPYRIYGQHIGYLWRANSVSSWEEACQRGECNDIQQAFWKTKPVEELYDTENDPWEVNNLASDPAFADVVLRMRNATMDWMNEIRDSGFIPEAELTDRAGDLSIYDYMRTGEVPLEAIIQAAEKSVTATENDLPELALLLKSEDSAIRYWGATGALMLGDKAAPLVPQMKGMLSDASTNVRILISETLYRMGYQADGREGLIAALGSPHPMARTHALVAIECVGEDSEEVQEAVISWAQKAGRLSTKYYDHRAARVLLAQWEIDYDKYGITAEW